MVNKFQYKKWTLMSTEEESKVAKSLRLRGVGQMIAYIILLFCFVAFVVLNMVVEKPNFIFGMIFCLLSLAAFAGLGNQVKERRKCKGAHWEQRDAYITNLHYNGHVFKKLYRIEASVKEGASTKTIIFNRSYMKVTPKIGEQVLLVRLEHTTEIYIYKKIKEA